MIITKLTLKNYKKFRNSSFDFNSGVNVILGMNEAGKSTIAAAILDVLFLNPTLRNRDIQKHISWNTEQLGEISINFEIANQKYELTKNFQDKTAILKNLSNGIEVKGANDCMREMQQIMPLKTAEAYSGTAFITHDDLSKLHIENNELSTALQNLALNGSAKLKINNIIHDIDKRRKELLKGLERKTANQGLIRANLLQQSELQQKISAIKLAIEQAVTLADEKEQLQNQISKLQPKIEELRSFINVNDALEKARDDYEAVNKQLDDIMTDIDTLEALEKSISEIDDNTAQYRDLLTEEAVQDYQQLLAHKIEEPKQTSLNKYPLIFAMVIGIALFLLLAIVLNNYWLLLPSVLFLVALFYLLSKSNIGISKAGEDSSKIIEQILLKYNFTNKTDFIKSFEFVNKQMVKKEALLENQASISKNKNIVDLIKKRKEIISKKLTIEEKYPDVLKNIKSTSDLQIHRYKLELQSLVSALEETKNRLLEIRGEVKQHKFSTEDLSLLEEELSILIKQEHRLSEEVKMLDLIVEAIDFAISDLAKNSSQLIATEINKYLSVLTDNRYEKVRLENNLTLEIWSSTKKDWVNPELELSRGTQDLVYFLARLAFIKLIMPENRLPILLDDPFLTFDKNRLNKAIQVLQEISQDTQIIYFSFNEALSKSFPVMQL